MSAESDRELLEWAAKAANQERSAAGDLWSNARRMLWNPLTDDGDALRLAVKLGLSPEVRLDASQPLPWLRVVHRSHDARGEYQESWEHMGPKEYAADPLAATRRAIVRAAAEIGRAMP